MKYRIVEKTLVSGDKVYYMEFKAKGLFSSWTEFSIPYTDLDYIKEEIEKHRARQVKSKKVLENI